MHAVQSAFGPTWCRIASLLSTASETMSGRADAQYVIRLILPSGGFRNSERGVQLLAREARPQIFGLLRPLSVTLEVRTEYLEATLGLVKCLEINKELRNPYPPPPPPSPLNPPLLPLNNFVRSVITLCGHRSGLCGL